MPVPFNRGPLHRNGPVPVFVEPDRYIRSYETIASDHLKSLDESNENPFIEESLWVTLEASTRKILDPLIKPGDVMFDAGVGLGRLLAAYPDHERHGVDISLGYLERAAAKGINVALALLEDLPYADEVFDIITSTDVLEHVVDFYGATREMVRVLKPGGHLVLRVPYKEDMKTYYDYRAYEFVHLRRFDEWGLRLHFERVLGLEFITKSTAGVMYRGAPLARMTPLADPAPVLEILEKLPDDILGMPEMRDFLKMTPQLFEQFMNALHSRTLNGFKQVEPLLAEDVELNMAFRKPG